MTSHSQAEVLERIHSALQAARAIFQRFTPGEIETEYKSGHDPVTEADKAVDAALRKQLLRDDEGWLSEESVDDFTRLQKKRVWVVDPLDGTREFVAGIPEFCVSVAMIEDGRPVAGGICNPATDELFLGSLDSGMTYQGKSVRASQRPRLEGAVILASRSETARGEWKQFENAPFKVRPMGSVAYKLALVSAGLADATFTLTPKHEWDVAAGAALVESAGGVVRTLEDQPLLCNRRSPKLSGLVAGGPLLYNELRALLGAHLSTASFRPPSR
jgi:myo-inositol-1(or 4)-monophosphatase